MRLLLDTHVFLWYISRDDRLPGAYLEAIEDLDNEVLLSVVSIWECLIKHQLGKLPFPDSPANYLAKQRDDYLMASLDVDDNAMSELAKLPLLHRDPFDRVLIAQANQHGLTLLTVDAAMAGYDVAILPPG